MGYGGSWSLIEALSVSVTQDVRCFSGTNKYVYAFSFLASKHGEPQAINAKLFLPRIPIGIVAFVGQLLSKQLYLKSAIPGLSVCVDLCRLLCRLHRSTPLTTKVRQLANIPLKRTVGADLLKDNLSKILEKCQSRFALL